MANMMEFVDNNWLMKAVELCISRAEDVFGPASDFTSEKLLKIIRERAAESMTVDVLERDPFITPVITSPIASSTSASNAAAREAFFADMSGEAALASRNYCYLSFSLITRVASTHL